MLFISLIPTTLLNRAPCHQRRPLLATYIYSNSPSLFYSICVRPPSSYRSTTILTFRHSSYSYVRHDALPPAILYGDRFGSATDGTGIKNGAGSRSHARRSVFDPVIASR